MKKMFLFPMLLFVMFFALLGCQKQSTTNAKDEPVRITVLAGFENSWIKNFSPYNNSSMRNAILGFIHEYLMLFNEMDNMKPIPWLAKSAVLDDDLQTIRIELREGVRWSDGTPFSADDVVFSFGDYPKENPEIDRQGFWGESGKLQDIRKTGDLSVEIVLAQKNAFGIPFLLNEAAILPKHIWQGIDEPATAVIENPVGTGPFTELKQFSPQLYVMGRNPYYWKADELKIDEMVWPQFNSNETSYDSLKDGKIDWAFVFIPDVENVYVAGNADNRYWFPPNGGVRITMNFQAKDEANRKAFNNVNFRRAVSLAMDRKSMMEIGAYGYVQGGNPATGMHPVHWNWRNKEADAIWAQYYRYDLDAARNELAEGGFADTDGDGFVENADGTAIQFGVLVPSGWTDWVNNTQIAVEGLREIGINAEVSTVEVPSYSAVWQPGDFDVIFAGATIQPTVQRYYDFTMHSRYHNTSQWSASNLVRYQNSELDSLIDQMALTGDPAQQQKIADQIELLYANEIVDIPLYYNGLWHLYNTARFSGWATEEDPFINPAVVNNDNKLYQLLRLRPKNEQE